MSRVHGPLPLKRILGKTSIYCNPQRVPATSTAKETLLGVLRLSYPKLKKKKKKKRGGGGGGRDRDRETETDRETDRQNKKLNLHEEENGLNVGGVGESSWLQLCNAHRGETESPAVVLLQEKFRVGPGCLIVPTLHYTYSLSTE